MPRNRKQETIDVIRGNKRVSSRPVNLAVPLLRPVPAAQVVGNPGRKRFEDNFPEDVINRDRATENVQESSVRPQELANDGGCEGQMSDDGDDEDSVVQEADVPDIELGPAGADGIDRVADCSAVIIDDNLEANGAGGGDWADEDFFANIDEVAPEDMYDYVNHQAVTHGINITYHRHYHSDSDPLEDFLPRMREDPGDLLLPEQDPQSSQLAKIVAKIPRDLRFDQLRLLTESNVTREFTCDLLTLLRPHVRSFLPKDYRTLSKDIPIAAMSSWITHVCVSCKKRGMHKYNFGHRGKIQFPECHKVLDYNSDHYIVADVAEVLALILPSIWKWRNQDLLPPHMKTMMLRNNMNFSTDVTLTISSDGVQVFNSSGLSVWSVMACVDGIPYHVQRKSVFEMAILCAREEGKNFQVTCMLDDILKQVQRLNLEPFSWIWNGVEMKTRVLISRAVADTLARSTLQGLNMFRSLYGCNYCYQTSEKGY